MEDATDEDCVGGFEGISQMIFDPFELRFLGGCWQSIATALVGNFDSNQIRECGVGARDSGKVEGRASGFFSLKNCVFVFHWWNLLGWLGESKVSAEREVVGAEAGAGGAGEGG